MCKWRTKGINSFTGTYIERQGKRGIDSPAHGADSKEEKSKDEKKEEKEKKKKDEGEGGPTPESTNA